MSAPMVVATLSGRKTETRRIVKGCALEWLDVGFTPEFVASKDNGLSPYGCAGDSLWVRETWAQGQDILSDYPSWVYRADLSARLHGYEKPSSELDTFAWDWSTVKWKPSIFMPKDASRITLHVKSVHIERLQDISSESAIKEGIEPNGSGYINYLNKGNTEPLHPIESFRTLWQSINGKDSWHENPFVWVINYESFTV